MDARVLERHLATETDTARFGEDIALALKPGDMVALQGDLGAGKTSLARAIIRSLAGDAALDVPSPTFTLVQSYEARIPVDHFDLYRLAAPEELDELGLDEGGRERVALVEWPERAGGRFDGAIHIALWESGDGRDAVVSGPPGALARLTRSFAIRGFLAAAGKGDCHRAFLLGDASVRAYEAIENGEPLILMDAPERPDGPPVRDGLPYSRVAHLAESVSPFVAIARLLRDKGFSAPAIHAQDLDAGLLLLDDLGREPFVGPDRKPIEERYLAAAELLAAIHAETWPESATVTGDLTHTIPRYDAGAMAIETELLTDWYMPYTTGAAVSEAEHATYRRVWRALFERAARSEQSLVLRDYHSPNLIWRGEREGLDRLGLIDFQDALIGPSAYDVASLALDARVTIPSDLERRIVDAYCAARDKAGAFDRTAFEAAYAIMGAQRNSKILGIFVRLDQRDGKPAYLAHLPRIRGYMRRVLTHPVLAELAAFHEAAGLLEGDVE